MQGDKNNGQQTTLYLLKPFPFPLAFVVLRILILFSCTLQVATRLKLKQVQHKMKIFLMNVHVMLNIAFLDLVLNLANNILSVHLTAFSNQINRSWFG